MLGLWREENQWTQRKVSVEERFDQVDFLTLNDDVNQCLLWLVITHNLLELTDTCMWMRSWKTCFLCIVQHGTRFWKCLWDFFRLSKWKPQKKLSRSYLQRKKMEKRRQKEFLTTWECLYCMQENFTTVAIVCHICCESLAVLQNVFGIFALSKWRRWKTFWRNCLQVR